MQIPREIIEKAIAGGWAHSGKRVRRVTLDDKERTPETYTVEIGDTELEYCKYMMWQAVALDPHFWQALGKELGWPQISAYSRESDNEHETWRMTALSFYDLILTGGDTDAFWRELLK
jgi:hypothetical protein